MRGLVLGLILLPAAGLLAVVGLAAFAPEPPRPSPVPLCQTYGRFLPQEQEAWDFWMGPYGFVPCRWIRPKESA